MLREIYTEMHTPFRLCLAGELPLLLRCILEAIDPISKSLYQQARIK